MPMPRPIRPNSNPPRIVQERVSKKSRRRIKIVTNQVPNLHRRAASSPKMLTPREQGDFGELSAMQWLAWQGASVAVPVGNNRHWNLIVDLDGQALRVQVKTARSWRLGRVGGGTALRLGGPKYAEFEVEPGHPIPGCTVEVPASTIAS